MPPRPPEAQSKSLRFAAIRRNQYRNRRTNNRCDAVLRPLPRIFQAVAPFRFRVPHSIQIELVRFVDKLQDSGVHVQVCILLLTIPGCFLHERCRPPPVGDNIRNSCQIVTYSFTRHPARPLGTRGMEWISSQRKPGSASFDDSHAPPTVMLEPVRPMNPVLLNHLRASILQAIQLHFECI